MDMNNYYKYFLKGWWAQLLLVLINIASAIVLVPLVFIVNGSVEGYYLISTIAYIFIVVPFGGWLFIIISAKHVQSDKERSANNVT